MRHFRLLPQCGRVLNSSEISTAYNGRLFTEVSGKTTGSNFNRAWTDWPLKMRIVSPEMSVRNYISTLRKIPKECRSQNRPTVAMKSHTYFHFSFYFFFFLILSTFYPLIVGVLGYWCTWSHSVTHSDTPKSVGLLWTSDQAVAENST
jgi:hypothetical protein